ncbi:MAG: nucleotidyltransferase domain-containing protein, partial [Candidatus Jacksonbacteria bacterium]|nr:nucleotidyltransferase domain-containing protein [Candidatus Jacksonbacteria bacterium]
MISITPEQKKQLHTLSTQYALNFIALFGSHAQECARKESDIDIAVSTKEKLDYKQEFFLHKELSKILKQNTIDLVQAAHASPLL